MTCVVHCECSLFLLEVTCGHLVTFATVSHCRHLERWYSSIILELCVAGSFSNQEGARLLDQIGSRGLQMEGGLNASAPAQRGGQGSLASLKSHPCKCPQSHHPLRVAPKESNDEIL